MKIDKINRLIELKTEHLNELRQDLQRLDQLKADSRKQHEQAIAYHNEYAIQLNSLEQNGAPLLAVDMIERRRFLAKLHNDVDRSADALAEVNKQQEYARQGLNQAYVEMKSLELLAERKALVKQHQDNRKIFTLADDEHTTRGLSVGE